METFNLQRVMVRAKDVLPAGGFAKLSREDRELVLRTAWAIAEVDGPATSDEQAELDRFAELLSLAKRAATWGPGLVGQAAIVAELAKTPRDAAFRRCLYAAAYVAGMSDGMVGAPEQRLLDEVASAIALDASARQELAKDLHVILYEEILETVFKDGDVSKGERRILNATRKLLGIDEGVAARIENEFRERRARGDSFPC